MNGTIDSGNQRRGKYELQPPITITSAQAQETRFAMRVPAGTKSALAIVNVLGFSGTSANIWAYTATDLDLDPEISSLFWVAAGSTGSVSAAGAKSFTVTPVGSYVRWNVTGTFSSVRFSVTIFPFDA